jgi:hypothetical protein
VRSGLGKNSQEQTLKEKSIVVSNEKKWIAMNPI